MLTPPLASIGTTSGAAAPICDDEKCPPHYQTPGEGTKLPPSRIAVVKGMGISPLGLLKILFLKICSFILGVLGLHCQAWVSAAVADRRCPSCSVPASLAVARRLWQPRSGFSVAALGLHLRLSSCGACAQLLRCMWDLLGPGMEPRLLPRRWILHHWTTREAPCWKF